MTVNATTEIYDLQDKVQKLLNGRKLLPFCFKTMLTGYVSFPNLLHHYVGWLSSDEHRYAAFTQCKG